jgi:large subunit ribosomal protein L3
MSEKMGLIGRKIGMTRVFWEDGTALGCTAIALGPNVVTTLRTQDKDGYSAIALGLGEKPSRLVNRPEAGQAKKIGRETVPRVIREVRLNAADAAKFEVGKEIKVTDVFKQGDVVDVTGTSKGKGYQGVMKRHRMSGFKASHGVHEFYRHGGSLGCRLTPGRVFKGKRMTGHMGMDRKTIANLVVVRVLEAENVVLIKGAIPGPANGLVMVRSSAKDVKRYIVRGEVKEQESKNPMKASKKGAPTKK